jgi:hypothetical protein
MAPLHLYPEKKWPGRIEDIELQELPGFHA